MRWAIIGLLAMASTTTGCLRNMDVPQDFVSVDRDDLGPYDVRAVSADGVVVGLRHESNSNGGTLAFWSEAAANEMKNQGYKFVKAEEVTSASGQAGKLVEFTADQRGMGFTYLLAVYVNPREVLLAEAGGRADDFKKHQDAVRKALLSVR